MSSYISIIAGTGQIIGQDIDATIREQMHSDAGALGLTVEDYVHQLTPIRTGALIMDITHQVGTGDDIVTIYAENIAQEAFWHRIYVQYQEGGPLGEPTYTNDPHLMFMETADGAGLAFTQVWAEAEVQIAVDRCIIGAGVPGF